MKVVIDARMYGLEHAGIGRYIANLIKEIRSAKSADEIRKLDVTILARKKNHKELRPLVSKGLRVVVVDIPHYSLAEQTLLPFYLLKLRPDLVHIPHFNAPILWPGKFIITIHDLIKHESRGPETTTRGRPFYWFKYLNYRLLVAIAIRRATKIITPSNWWKDELIRRYKLPPEKIMVTYEGVDKNFNLKAASGELSAEEILKKYKIKEPFVIYTGSLYPHKNVERLVQAIKRLRGLKLSLVVVCARNIFYERFAKKVRRMESEKFINLVGFVPDKELVQIYRKAEAFVFPSLLEGFGLPGLEAMAVGLPVIASSSSCLPEIYGKAALYFNPLSVDDMGQKIKTLMTNKEMRADLVKEGFKQVTKYSWEKMARQTLNIYRSALLQ